MNFSRNTKLGLGLVLAAGAVIAACSSDSTNTPTGGGGANTGGATTGAGGSHAGASTTAGSGGAVAAAGASGASTGAGGAHAGAGGAGAAGSGGAATTAGSGGAAAGTGGAAAGSGGAAAGTGGAAAAGTGGTAAGAGGATAGAGGTTAGAGGAAGGAAAGSGGASAGTGGVAGSAGSAGSGGATPCGGCVDLQAQFNDKSEVISTRIDLNNAGVDLAGATVTASVKIVSGEPDAGIQLYLQDTTYASDYPYVSIGSFNGDTASFHDIVTQVPSVAPDGGTLPYDVHHVKQIVLQLNSGSVVPKTLEILIDKITVTGAPAAYGPYTFDTSVSPLVANGGSTKADGGVAPTPILTWVP